MERGTPCKPAAHHGAPRLDAPERTAERSAAKRTAANKDPPGMNPPERTPEKPPAPELSHDEDRSEKTTWETFFDAHAPVYEENDFTQDTLREVDFLLEELELPPGASVLDVGCGTGRHSIELARRGYQVTGLDLSSEMLARAAAAAETAGVRVEWIRADATRFTLPGHYDAAICLCEGAFGLLGAGDDAVEQPLSILRNIRSALKPGARVILTVLNGTLALRRYQNSDVAEGRFDPLSLVESSAHPPREGLPPVPVRERSFVPSELVLLCRLAGLSVQNLWGGSAGNWGRRPLDLDEMEVMMVAKREAEGANSLDETRKG
jgi:SAM-dependent methyltransferase